MISFWVWSALVYGGSFTAVLYASFLSWYRRVWELMPIFNIPDSFTPTTSISVLIPARNESRAIIACILSLKKQNYPSELFEVIVINDGSEDDTEKKVRTFHWDHLRLITRSDGGGKKKAIEHGVAAAKNQLIVTTDADCIVPENWLRYHAAAFEQFDAAFLAAPVAFSQEANFLQQFQTLDLMGMMVLTGAGISGHLHYLSNGANMSYPKKEFMQMGGYHGHAHASGDDIYLIQHIARRTPKRVIFIKHLDATVNTQSPTDWKSFWQQRIRWATKNKSSKDRDMLFSLVQSFLMCWFIIISFAGTFWFGGKSLVLAVTLFGAKAFQDYHLLKKASTFFGRPELMQYFWPAQIMHILYIATVGLAANLIRHYVWKGRKVR